jgi:hypothetical protein
MTPRLAEIIAAMIETKLDASGARAESVQTDRGRMRRPGRAHRMHRPASGTPKGAAR